MKETLLIYHIDKNTREFMQEIADQLHIDMMEIEESQINETMGFLLHMKGYIQSNITSDEYLDQSFVFFAGMSDNQLDIILQLFRMQGIPKIPYKAMLTEHNVHYTFVQLYQSVADEYQQIEAMNNENR